MVTQPQASSRLIDEVLLPTAAYHLAVIGDFGSRDAAEGAVATMVKEWQPAAIVTVGDNIYPDGSGSYDEAVGAYYAPFLGNYHGKYGLGSPTPRFWPAPGNHDWALSGALDNYRAFFTLPPEPGGERYYDTPLDNRGLAWLYVVDSDPHEPDGIKQDSKQARWLRDTLARHRADACFHLVAFHHPPYTTRSGHPPTETLRWPFRPWGVDLVLNGHNHHYERLVVDGLPYVIAGHGGAQLYEKRGAVAADSASFDADRHGAVRLGVGPEGLGVEAFPVGISRPTDRFAVRKPCTPRTP